MVRGKTPVRRAAALRWQQQHAGPFPPPYRGIYFFADCVNGFMACLDVVNGNVAYAFARGFVSPVDLLMGTDGALYVLTRGSIVQISAP